MNIVTVKPVEVNQEHINQIRDDIRRFAAQPAYYQFAQPVRPKLIVYGHGSTWHVATHDGVCVSRIWSTWPTHAQALDAWMDLSDEGPANREDEPGHFETYSPWR